MGNCQAAEAAAVVIQHPGGKVERLYGPATAGDVMRSNPGHYVALVVLRVSAAAKVGGGGGANKQDPASIAGKGEGGGGATTRITKVKLLKPGDGLLLGQVYRLITSQEVAKAIEARRQDKTRRIEAPVDDDQRRRHRSRHGHAAATVSRDQHDERKQRSEKASDWHRSRGGGGGRHWHPSLQSISEFPSS